MSCRFDEHVLTLPSELEDAEIPWKTMGGDTSAGGRRRSAPYLVLICKGSGARVSNKHTDLHDVNKQISACDTRSRVKTHVNGGQITCRPLFQTVWS